MECRFLSEAVQERLKNFCDFSAKEKIKALKYILKGKEKKVFCEKRGTNIVLPCLKKIEEKYEAIRFCLEQCKDEELKILKLEMGQRKLGVQHSMEFVTLSVAMMFGFWTLGKDAIEVAQEAVTVAQDVFSKMLGEVLEPSEVVVNTIESVNTTIRSMIVMITLACLFIILIIMLSSRNELTAKRANYISDMIDLIEQERKEKKALTTGSGYATTI